MTDRTVGGFWASLTLATAIVATAVAPPLPAGPIPTAAGALVLAPCRSNPGGRAPSVAASSVPGPARDEGLPGEGDEDLAAASMRVDALLGLAPGPTDRAAVAFPPPPAGPARHPLRC